MQIVLHSLATFYEMMMHTKSTWHPARRGYQKINSTTNIVVTSDWIFYFYKMFNSDDQECDGCTKLFSFFHIKLITKHFKLLNFNKIIILLILFLIYTYFFFNVLVAILLRSSLSFFSSFVFIARICWIDFHNVWKISSDWASFIVELNMSSGRHFPDNDSSRLLILSPGLSLWQFFIYYIVFIEYLSYIFFLLWLHTMISD